MYSWGGGGGENLVVKILFNLPSKNHAPVLLFHICFSSGLASSQPFLSLRLAVAVETGDASAGSSQGSGALGCSHLVRELGAGPGTLYSPFKVSAQSSHLHLVTPRHRFLERRWWAVQPRPCSSAEPVDGSLKMWSFPSRSIRSCGAGWFEYSSLQSNATYCLLALLGIFEKAKQHCISFHWWIPFFCFKIFREVSHGFPNW